jgi:uncharacterized delta-60 repeat protein
MKKPINIPVLRKIIFAFVLLVLHYNLLAQSTGAIDLSFNPGSGPNNRINCIAIQSDDKIVIGGEFQTYNGIQSNLIARLNTDGSLDTAFKTVITGTAVHAIAIQKDGKIIIGGSFTKCNGVARANMARLNSNGSLDQTLFPSGVTYLDATVYAVAVQSDGKILVGGDFNSTYKRFARLNSDGTQDASFTAIYGVDDRVYAAASSSVSHQEAFGGKFWMFNNKGFGWYAYNHVLQLDIDGNPINANGVDGVVTSLAFQSDGQLLMAGKFSTNNGLTRRGITRHSVGADPDPNFNLGAGTTEQVNTIALQADGKILIAGFFHTYDGVPRIRIARLNTNGSLDSSFDPGAGADSTIRSIALQSDGKVIIGGDFISYDGTPRNYIARLGLMPVGLRNSLTSNDIEDIVIYPNPSDGIVSLMTTHQMQNAEIILYDLQGQILVQQRGIQGTHFNFDFSSHGKGIYVMKFLENNEIYYKKMVVY